MEGEEELVDEEGTEVLQEEDCLPADLGAQIFDDLVGALIDPVGLQRLLIVGEQH